MRFALMLLDEIGNTYFAKETKKVAKLGKKQPYRMHYLTVLNRLRLLEEKGFITKWKDGNAYYVKITETGKIILQKYLLLLEKYDTALKEEITKLWDENNPI